MPTSDVIRAALAPLVPIINGANESRVYPHYAKEIAAKDTPYIIYNDMVSSNPERTLEEYTGHEHVRVQIDVYDRTFNACRLLKDQIIWAMEAAGAEYIGSQSLSEPTENLYRRTIDFYMWQTNCD